MLRRSHDLFALSFIVFLIFFGLYKQYGIVFIPPWTSIVALF